MARFYNRVVPDNCIFLFLTNFPIFIYLKKLLKLLDFRPEHGNGKDQEESFTCPKCNREFRNTTLLTRHVNDCLDRDY